MAETMQATEKEFHLSEIKKRAEAAQAIIDKADSEHREVTEAEDAEYKSHMTRITEARQRVEQIEQNEARREQLKALGTVPEIATQEAVEVPARSIGEAFTKSADYRRVMEVARSEGMPKFETKGVELKAPGDAVLESTGDNATAIAPTWFGLETPDIDRRPLRIADVMNVVQIGSGNTANYPVVTTRSYEAGATSEGATKSGAEFAFDFRSETLIKHAVIAGYSEELFQDAPTLANFINTDLGIMALEKEEDAIVTELFTATTQATDGSSLQATPTPFDAIRHAMALVEIAGGNATAILLHPLDAAFLDTTRNGDDDYYSGGPYAAALQGLWGQIRQVRTRAVDQGTAIVGDFGRGARLFRKGGLRVDSTNAHDTWFAENKVAVRAEIRSVTGVTYPNYFAEVQLGTS